MNKVSCAVVRDLLPLYVDDVVSEESRELVESHVENCEECRRELDAMRAEVAIPAESTGGLEKVRRTWRRKRTKLIIGSVLATALLLGLVHVLVFYVDRVIPYSSDLMEIEEQGEELVSHYYGESYALVGSTHPMTVMRDGEEQQIAFIYYTETFADGPSRQLIGRSEESYAFTLARDEEIIDAVVYAEFDAEKMRATEETWEDVLARGKVMWERE